MRLDQAVVCLAPQRLPEALQALKACRPRSLVLLTHGEPSADPVEDMTYCRSWGALNDCAVLGPRAFGVQRPHLGLNLSLQTQISLGGWVALLAQARFIAAALRDWAAVMGLVVTVGLSVGGDDESEFPGA